MSGNTVTITAALADELRRLLLEAQRMPAIRHDAVELAERLDIAVRLAADVANSRPPGAVVGRLGGEWFEAHEPAQVIELPRVPGRETATAVEALVAKTMLDMPPPISVSVVFPEGHRSFDTWAAPAIGDVLAVSDKLRVRVVSVYRDVLKPNVFYATALTCFDERGGPF